jgi:hypothetical protein
VVPVPNLARLKADDWTSGDINWLLDVLSADQKSTTQVHGHRSAEVGNLEMAIEWIVAYVDIIFSFNAARLGQLSPGQNSISLVLLSGSLGWAALTTIGSRYALPRVGAVAIFLIVFIAVSHILLVAEYLISRNSLDQHSEQSPASSVAQFRHPHCKAWTDKCTHCAYRNIKLDALLGLHIYDAAGRDNFENIDAVKQLRDLVGTASSDQAEVACLGPRSNGSDQCNARRVHIVCLSPDMPLWCRKWTDGFNVYYRGIDFDLKPAGTWSSVVFPLGWGWVSTSDLPTNQRSMSCERVLWKATR